MQFPRYIIDVIKRIEAEGYSAYLVGGSVRDAIRRAPIHDWDIACSARPHELKTIFQDSRILDTGIQHGTITVVCDEGAVEVTTFRSDGAYLDLRHPATIGFVDTVEEDLGRRDFTMNAIAYNPSSGFIDPFKGREAIAEGIIRSVGDPDRRLSEDALRIMRALRFSATLGYAIDENLAESLHANKGLLTAISPERISIELIKMLIGQNILSVLTDYPDVLSVVIPEIEPTLGFDQKSRYHQYDVWEHTARAVAYSKPDPVVRLALLLHDLGKPAKFFVDGKGTGHFYNHDLLGEELAKRRLKQLRFSNSMITSVSAAIRFHQIRLKPENTQKWLARLGEDTLRLVIEVCRGDMAAHADAVIEAILSDLHASEARLAELLEEEACFRLSDLAIDGNDLLAIGIMEGKDIGRVLSQLLEAVVEGDLENNRETLLVAAESSSALLG